MRPAAAAVRRLALAGLIVGTLAAAACERPETAEADRPFVRTMELGPVTLGDGPPETAAIVRGDLAPEGLSWIVGLRTESGPDVRVTDAGITLDVEADVIRVSADAPSLDLPEGLGVPVLRARADLPGTWRGLHATARAVGRNGVVPASRIRLIVKARGPAADAVMEPVWRIPVDVDPRASVVRDASGASTVKVPLADALPAAGTIHALVPRTAGRVREVRIVAADGNVAARRVRDGTGVIGSWTDARGVEVGVGTLPRLEFDLEAGVTPRGIAIDVYLRPADGVALRYPDPSDVEAP